MNVEKILYKDYEELFIKNTKLAKENRDLKYLKKLEETKNERLIKRNKKIKEQIKEQQKTIEKQEYEIARLKALLNIDGTNHGIPTSKTPIHKTKVIPNTREKSELKKGGQVGHKKHKLEKFKEEEITEVIEHKVESCPNCKSHSIETTGKVKEKDELDYKIVVEKRRHKFIEYTCRECGRIFHENIPTRLKEDNQYGPQVEALELTLMNQANVPINKAQKITYGMTNGKIDLSEGYISKLQKRAANNLKEFMTEVKKELIKGELLYWDDTVIMINTKRSCLRFYGRENLAYYVAHLKKDKEGLDEDGILKLLPKETVVVHDHNKVNYNKEYIFSNAECNRHLISDLKKVIDNLEHIWAKKMIKLLTSMNKKREWLMHKGKEEFEQEDINKFEEKFRDIMLEAHNENEKENPQRYYVDKEKTLLLRILDYKNEYLLWIYDFDVPFTNNLSERALRGAKSKMKSAGQFWNKDSASYYATIKTYIETCNRNGINIYNALLALSIGKPYTLKEILSKEV